MSDRGMPIIDNYEQGWKDGMAEAAEATADLRLGYEEGYRDGQASRRSTYAILTDLIAELRDGCARQEEAVGPLITTHRVREHLHRAEARRLALIAESTRLRAAATEHHATKAILQDLIAELRSACDLWQASGTDGVVHRVMPISEVIRLAGRAEARLREWSANE